MVRRCLDLGITFLDTANDYTTGEARIGKAIEGRREEVVIATRFYRRRDYCRPCPQEIPIATIMLVNTVLKRMPPERLLTGVFAEQVQRFRAAKQQYQQGTPG